MNKISEQMKQKIAVQSGNYLGNGLHCAEAVVMSILEAAGEPYSEAIAHATAFGGGVGKTYEETCGALSGALIVIGHYHGRRFPGENWDNPARLGAELRERFVSDFGSTHCATLRNRFGQEAQMCECRKLVQIVTESLLDTLATSEKAIGNT